MVELRSSICLFIKMKKKRKEKKKKKDLMDVKRISVQIPFPGYEAATFYVE
jgi:hypothetical protein